MKALCLALSLAFSAGAFAQSNPVVRWNRIVGVITAPGIDNPVGVAPNQIHSGAGPWTTRGGSAHVNLLSGEGSFEVEGLVLNGGNASGTPGPINSVVGTLVCNAGTAAQATADTPATELSADRKRRTLLPANRSGGVRQTAFSDPAPTGRTEVDRHWHDARYAPWS